MERVLVVGARCRMKGGSASPSAGRSGGGVRERERQARLVKVVTSAAVEAQLVLEASLQLVPSITMRAVAYMRVETERVRQHRYR